MGSGHHPRYSSYPSLNFLLCSACLLLVKGSVDFLNTGTWITEGKQRWHSWHLRHITLVTDDKEPAFQPSIPPMSLADSTQHPLPEVNRRKMLMSSDNMEEQKWTNAQNLRATDYGKIRTQTQAHAGLCTPSSAESAPKGCSSKQVSLDLFPIPGQDSLWLRFPYVYKSS